ncbi:MULTISPECIES: hypothetical protein [Microbispora]|uniref:ATP-binding protein n=1 Tax=Microbispora hainanensis TaxID=568844 RepID=A0ABZ1SW63_9ACTN|nr:MULTISPECIES: hypothetical protein [Microbispora]
MRLTYLEAVGKAGEPQRATVLAARLVEDSNRVLGPEHLVTLAARSALAGWTMESGDEGTGLRLFEALHSDARRLLGDEHWLVVQVGATLKQL